MLGSSIETTQPTTHVSYKALFGVTALKVPLRFAMAETSTIRPDASFLTALSLRPVAECL